MNLKPVFALVAALSMPVLAQSDGQSVELKRFEEEKTLPRDLYAPTMPGEDLPGPDKLAPGTCVEAPEVCKARKEELRRKRQACRDGIAGACDDPALKQAARD